MSKAKELADALMMQAKTLRLVVRTINAAATDIETSSAELRRLAQMETEYVSLLKAISEAEPVAWRCRVGEHPWWLENNKPPPKLLMEIEPLYTLNGTKP